MSPEYVSRFETAGETAWPTEHRLLTVTLSAGFALVAIAVLIARAAPATGHEISIYRATPAAVWLLLGLAFLVAVYTVVTTDDPLLTAIATGLGLFSMLTFASMPILRGYRFHGLADPMTHLGWIRDLHAGRMAVGDLYYPGGHTWAVALAELTGIPDTAATMLVVILFAVVYFVFMGLAVRHLVPYPRAGVIGLLGAFMLLPTTNISTEFRFHSFTLATFFFALVLFLFVLHVTVPAERTPRLAGLSTTGIGLTLALLGIVFVHPQVTLNVLIFLWPVLAVQFVARRIRPESAVAGTGAIYLPVLVATVVWVMWNMQHPHLFRVGGTFFDAIVGFIEGTAGLADDSQEQLESARAVASTTELFVKMFLVSAAYVGLSGATVLAAWRGRASTMTPQIRQIVTYVVVAFVLLGPFFLLHLAGDRSQQFFRHFGFTMAIATFLGSIGLVTVIAAIATSPTRRVLLPILAGLLGVALILSLMTVFPSPYVYYQSHHGTDHEFDGYAIAFEYADEEVAFSGIRRNPHRFVDALVAEGTVARVDSVSPEALHRPGAAYDDPYYIPITQANIDREVVAYHEIRYDAASLAAIEDAPRVDRVHTNDEFALYRVSETAIERAA